MRTGLVAAAVVAGLTTTSVANADDPEDKIIGAEPPASMMSVVPEGKDYLTTDTDRAILAELQRIRMILETSSLSARQKAARDNR